MGGKKNIWCMWVFSLFGFNFSSALNITIVQLFLTCSQPCISPNIAFIASYRTNHISHLKPKPEELTLAKLFVKVAQSCPTLCDPMNYTVHGILQARILEWVAFPFSREEHNTIQVTFFFLMFQICFNLKKKKKAVCFPQTRKSEKNLLASFFLRNKLFLLTLDHCFLCFEQL